MVRFPGEGHRSRRRDITAGIARRDRKSSGDAATTGAIGMSYLDIGSEVAIVHSSDLRLDRGIGWRIRRITTEIAAAGHAVDDGRLGIFGPPKGHGSMRFGIGAFVLSGQAESAGDRAT